jgi:RNA polymerase sigma factor (sigma-70 family)
VDERLESVTLLIEVTGQPVRFGGCRLPSDDSDLVDRTLRGELKTFEQLYDRYARLVRAICLETTHNLAEAQDISQEVFLRAFQRLPQLRERAKFSSWLVGIARLTVKEWQRKRDRDQHRFGSEVADNGSWLVMDHEDERVTLLLDLMNDMPAQERLALHAFYLEGQDAERAALLTGLSRSGFYKLLNNARQCLGRRYREKEGTLR